jgi:hypothetical protein
MSKTNDIIQAAQRWAQKRSRAVDTSGPRPKQSNKTTNGAVSYNDHLCLTHPSSPINLPPSLADLLKSYLGNGHAKSTTLPSALLEALKDHLKLPKETVPSALQDKGIAPVETWTAYALAARACGATWTELKLNGLLIPRREEAARALKQLEVEIRFSVIKDAKYPELLNRRHFLVEARCRGTELWQGFVRFPLITHVANGNVWQYGLIIKAGAQARQLPSYLSSIYWGNQQDFIWAKNFLDGKTRRPRRQK